VGYAELTGMRSQRVMGSSGGYDAGWELDSSGRDMVVENTAMMRIRS